MSLKKEALVKFENKIKRNEPIKDIFSLGAILGLTVELIIVYTFFRIYKFVNFFVNCCISVLLVSILIMIKLNKLH